MEMESESLPAPPTNYLKPLVGNSPHVFRVVALSLTVALLSVFLPLGLLRFFPLLKPMGVHILYRLREVFIFLAFTTVIAIGIFTSPRKDVAQKTAALDQYPLAAIFGEMGASGTQYDTSEAAEQKQGKRAVHRSAMETFDNAMDFGRKSQGPKGDPETVVRSGKSSTKTEDFAVPLQQGRFSGPATASDANNLSGQRTKDAETGKITTFHRRNVSASPDGGHASHAADPRLPTAAVVQNKLHRRSSSLDDSLNYEPEPETGAFHHESTAGGLPPSSIKAVVAGGSINSTPESDRESVRVVGTPKRVSFSIDTRRGDSPPHSYARKLQASRKESSPQKLPINQDNGGSTIGRDQDSSMMSPNELNRQADAFIAKFKEQMRMQRLESFQRYRRRLS